MLRHCACFSSLLLSAPAPLFAQTGSFCTNATPGAFRWASGNLTIHSIESDGTQAYPWPQYGYSDYIYDGLVGAWTTYPPPISRGGGIGFRAPSSSSVSPCFYSPTQTLMLPLSLPGSSLSLVSCQSNVVSTFEGMVGRAPMEGTRLFKYNLTGNPSNWDRSHYPAAPAAPDYNIFVFTNGSWSPSVPTADIGEAVFVYQPGVFVYQPRALNPQVSGHKFSFEMDTVYGTANWIENSD